MQQDTLGEKQLVLGEVTHLTDSLRGTAAEGRATGAQLAAAANAYQGKLRGVTRRMMATISELSLYQVRLGRLLKSTLVAVLCSESRLRGSSSYVWISRCVSLAMGVAGVHDGCIVLTMLGAAAGVVVQATALKLHASKEQLQELLETARARLDAGQAPTEEAEMEWAALCRQQQTLDDLKQQREEVGAAGCTDCADHVGESSGSAW
jgi:hypothetical protein